MKYAVFTVGLPEYTPEQALEKLKYHGYDGVEWRVTKIDPEKAGDKPSYWGNNLCTVDEARALALAPEIKALSNKFGLEICGLGTYLRSSADPCALENLMLAAKAMGTAQIRVSPDVYDGSVHYRQLFDQALKDYAVVEGLARKHGIKAVIEMHMNTIVASASAAYRLVSNFDPACIGVIYDTGNMVYEGFEDYKAGLEILGDYLAHVHIKNAIWKLDAEEDDVKRFKPDWAPFKGGHADFKRFFKALKSVGYDGWISFEDFSDEQSPDEKLKDNLEYIKDVVSKA
ncbi:MAG: sugar phosphate isomerase/epimerase [Oscillospiraceae bacterium]|nr:sugar phosphate isomerase/epimerase [Oscillospiraceae bacterium]